MTSVNYSPFIILRLCDNDVFLYTNDKFQKKINEHFINKPQRIADDNKGIFIPVRSEYDVTTSNRLEIPVRENGLRELEVVPQGTTMASMSVRNLPLRNILKHSCFLRQTTALG